MDNGLLKELQKRIKDYEDMKAEKIRQEEEASKRRIEEAKRRQEEEEANRKFEREARVIYSGTSKEGKTTIYEYEGKYYVGERKYEQERGAYGRIEFHLSNTEERSEITEEQIEVYRSKKEEELKAEAEQRKEQRRKEKEASKRRIEEAKKRQEEEEANRKFEREARVIYSGTSKEGKTTIYEYEGKYYVGKRKYEQERGSYGRIEYHLSNTEERSEITEEQISVYVKEQEHIINEEKRKKLEKKQREQEERIRITRQEEEKRKFEREARVIYSGISKDGKTTIYEYEGKYYVGKRKYEQERGAYGRIEYHLSNAEERSEITEEQIEQYVNEKEIAKKTEREQRKAQRRQEEEESKRRIEEAKRRQEEEEANRKFEREARIIYSGTSKEGKTTIYEYEGKYYVGERKYEQERGAYGRIEFHLSNTEERHEITEEQIEVYKGKKEEELKTEREQRKAQRRQEEEESKRRIEEAKRRQEEEEANRKFEREARVIHSSRTEDSKVSLYEYEGKYYVGERKYEQERGAYGRIELHLSNTEERSEITEEQIIQLFGNIELQPVIKEGEIVGEQEIQETKDDMSLEKRDITGLSGQQKSRISFNSIRQAIKKALGRGER